MAELYSDSFPENRSVKLSRVFVENTARTYGYRCDKHLKKLMPRFAVIKRHAGCYMRACYLFSPDREPSYFSSLIVTVLTKEGETRREKSILD